jgi:PAS domain S-box-containing protein
MKYDHQIALPQVTTQSAQAARLPVDYTRASIADLLWVTTANGILEEESPTWCAFTGQRGSNLVGWNWLASFHPDDRECIKAIWQQTVTRERVYEVVCRIRRYDGVYRTCLIRGIPRLKVDESVHEWVGLGTDITERGQAQQERAGVQAEGTKEAPLALLKSIMDALPSSIYLVRGYDARLILANRTAARVWGASWFPGQPIGEFLTRNRIRIFGMDGRPLALEHLATIRAVRQGETVLQHQEIIRHPDGSRLPVLVNAVALDMRTLRLLLPGLASSPGREVELAAIVVHQDVTIVKEAERPKDESIAIAVHELRNLLAILQGYAQAMLTQTRQGPGPELADWRRKALQDIDRVVLRMVELTENLLDVTRLQAGRLEVYLEPTDLVALAQRIVKRCQMRTERHRISLLTSLEHLVIHIDPGRVEQVLDNLIDNAIKYSPQGNPIEVTVREEIETGEAILSVRDYGIGIPMRQQASIFSRFMRTDNAHKIGGSSLGLYLCRALVEQHGGRIWFESVEGQGSTFFTALSRGLEDMSLREEGL